MRAVLLYVALLLLFGPHGHERNFAAAMYMHPRGALKTRLRAEGSAGSGAAPNRMGGNLLEKFVEKFSNYGGSAMPEADLTEDDKMLAAIKVEPWKADKIKNLPIVYRSTKDSWKERYFDPKDDTVYLYTIPGFKPLPERTRVDDLWNWPWMWSKVKADRLGWLFKVFYADCASMTVQEHMEMDALLSEFDMPVRWGLVRMKELDVLNAGFLNLCFFTDFTAIKPTDLGLRPDGSVKTCPVQFHNCISSSNQPSDLDHFAPPFRWSRDKSPDQAYDEIKNIYMNYPKRGLKWSSGWIDRGGWHPQQFSGPYFYAEAESLAFHYADDIELVLDVEKREVQYRSSTRLGAVDWDVERLRYNQFCRMLNKFGGWYTEPLPRLRWLARTPYHWTELVLDKSQRAVGGVLDNVAASLPGVVTSSSESAGAASRALDQLTSYVYPYLQPSLDKARAAGGELLLDPKVAAAVQVLQEWRDKVDAFVVVTEQEAQTYIDKVLKLLPERLLNFAPENGEVEMEKTNSMDMPRALPEPPPEPGSVPSAVEGGGAEITLSSPASELADGPMDLAGQAVPPGASTAYPLEEDTPAQPWRASKIDRSERQRTPQAAPSSGVEDIVLRGDAERERVASSETPALPRRRNRVPGEDGAPRMPMPRPIDLSDMETKVLRQQLEEVKESLYPTKPRSIRVF